MKDRTETVVFRSFYENGFALPAGAFFRGLLFFFGIEVTHLKPNSIAQIAIFIHLCKAFLGITLHFNMWRALYNLRGYPSAARRNMVGGATFSLCQGRSYPALELRDNNKGWDKEWFVVLNLAPCLPARTGVSRVLGRTADRGGDGPSESSPQRDRRPIGLGADRRFGGHVLQ